MYSALIVSILIVTLCGGCLHARGARVGSQEFALAHGRQSTTAPGEPIDLQFRWQQLRTAWRTDTKPDHEEFARVARWLVHVADWGALSTLDAATGGPMGGVISHSDGEPGSSTGRLFFYITPMDFSTQNIEADPRSTLTITEAQLLPDGCKGTDPEDPTCVKVTLIGATQPLVSSSDRAAAETALFSRHPDMADWPEDHGFDFYELTVERVQLLDWYGGMHVVTAQEYYQAQL